MVILSNCFSRLYSLAELHIFIDRDDIKREGYIVKENVKLLNEKADIQGEVNEE